MISNFVGYHLLLRNNQNTPTNGISKHGEFSMVGHINTSINPIEWEPFIGFIECRYADYGNVELIDTLINRVGLIKLFNRVVHSQIIIRTEENLIHEISFDRNVCQTPSFGGEDDAKM